MGAARPVSWVEVDLAAIRHNIHQVQLATQGLPLMAIVKANAYGHGLVAVAAAAVDAGVAALGVVSIEEALALRAGGIALPILVMNHVGTFLAKDLVREAIAHDISFAVFDLATAHFLDRLAGEQDKKVQVHLKIDTGTARLGIVPDTAVEFATKLATLPHLALVGIFTHFARAEEDPRTHTETQLALFSTTVEALRHQGFAITHVHASCSAALLRGFAHRPLTLGRLGLAMYGLWPSEETTRDVAAPIQLKSALSWYSTVLQVKSMEKGAAIGYGATYRMPQAGRIATIATGYADGFDRHLSNSGAVVINGQRAPIRGRICMNLAMVEVTQIPAVAAGTTVALLGGDSAARITSEEFAAWCGTINYDVPTHINWSIPRYYKNAHAA